MTRFAQSEVAAPRRPKASTLVRLIQAAVLAVVLVPVGSVALEGSVWYFDCNIENEFGCTSQTENAQSYTFSFGDYYLWLSFDMYAGGYIGVNVTPTAIGPSAENGTFASKADAFPGYACLAVTQSGECVEFDVDVFIGNSQEDWSHYTIEIGWNKIAGQDLEAARMTLLVDRDAAPNNGTSDYDYDVCLSGLYDDCVIDPDPGIRSGDTDFSTWIPSYRPVSVPEPSTLLLFGAGLSVAGLRRYRRR